MQDSSHVSGPVQENLHLESGLWNASVVIFSSKPIKWCTVHSFVFCEIQFFIWILQ